MDKNCKLNPDIELTRIPDEKVEQISYRNRYKPSSSSSCGQLRVINQDEEDDPNTSYLCIPVTEEDVEIAEESTWIQQKVHEYYRKFHRKHIKIEPDDNITTDISLETIDTYQSNTISNSIEHYPQQFNCDECWEIFNTSYQLMLHKNINHISKPHVCEICNEKFHLSAHLNLHLIKHASLPKNDSQKKGLKSIQSSSISNAKNNNQQQNVFKKSTIKPFKCSDCIFETKYETKFVDHKNYCNISGNNLKNNLPSNCQLLPKQFISRPALNGQMNYHSARVEIISRRQHLEQYMIIEKPKQSTRIYYCKYCVRQFMSLKKLHIHYSQHRKEMICNVCRIQFFVKKRFEKHMQVHTNLTIINHNENGSNTKNSNLLKQKLTEKEKKCTSMFANSQEKDGLLQKKDFKCLHCNSYYKSRKTFLAHNRQFHVNGGMISEQPLKLTYPKVKCNFCDIVITKQNLARHIRSIHPNAIPVK